MRKDYPPEPMRTLQDYWRDLPSGAPTSVYAFLAADGGKALGWTPDGRVKARKIAAQLSERLTLCITVRISQVN
jgi:hypothetical protein